MKRYFYLLAAMCIATAIPSCSDDDGIAGGDDATEDVVEPIPVEDLMSESVIVPTAVIGSGFDPVTEALIKRLKSRDMEITSDTKAVIIDGALIPELTAAQKDAISQVFDNGGSIILSEPDADIAYDFSVSLGEMPSFSVDGNMGDNHFCDVYVFNNHHDEYFVQDIHEPQLCETSDDCDDESEAGNEVDNGSETDAVYESQVVQLDNLTPYQYGLRADKLAVWINGNSEPHSTVSRSSGISGASGQRVAFDVYPAADHDKVAGKTGSYTIIYTITPLYSFSQNADYYAVHQEVIGSNSAMMVGNWKDGDYYYGVYLGRIESDHQLLTQYNACPPSAVIQTTSPATTQNARQETYGMSFSLGGDIGMSSSGPSAGISAGISYSESYTVSIPDISIINKCKSGESKINAKWEYITADPKPKFDFWENIKGFENAPDAATNTIDVHNTWLWVISNPSGSYSMKCENYIYYNYRYGRNKTFSYSYGTHWLRTGYFRWINIDPPLRTRQ